MEDTKQVLVIEDTTLPDVTPEQIKEVGEGLGLSFKGKKALRRGAPGAFGKVKNKPA